ncbi:NAD(P)H-dependent oxidoreductase [Amycolatopsis mediterranei]|uniref:NAD(P)H-dependent oxidoreductase n=1 Tax=Amycolatopsis mediterranei TaxID=33910 RepID=UPI00341D521F
MLIGAPMDNFSIPAALKAWIDQVTFPRMSLEGKAFVIAGARGGTYAEGRRGRRSTTTSATCGTSSPGTTTSTTSGSCTPN